MSHHIWITYSGNLFDMFIFLECENEKHKMQKERNEQNGLDHLEDRCPIVIITTSKPCFIIRVKDILGFIIQESKFTNLGWPKIHTYTGKYKTSAHEIYPSVKISILMCKTFNHQNQTTTLIPICSSKQYKWSQSNFNGEFGRAELNMQSKENNGNFCPNSIT